MTLDSVAVLYTVGAIASLTAAGWFRTRRTLGRLNKQRNEADTFLKLLERFRSSAGTDSDAYTKLTYMSAKIQANLGQLGVISYKPPASEVMIHNYQVVVNGLDELKHWLPLDDSFSTIKPGQQSADLIRDTVVRFLGVVDEWRFQRQEQLRNPFSLFAEGTRWILSSPVRLLGWLGLLPGSSASRVESNRLFRVLSGLIAFVSLVSAIIGLVTGWDAFIKILRRVLRL